MIRIVSAAVLVVLLGSLAACSDDDEPPQATDPGTTSELEFTESGGCGDAFFWAATADAEHAVVISAELTDRSTTEDTVLDVELPDEAVDVTLLEGTELSSRFCNDLIMGEVTETTPVVEGTVTITLQPRPEKTLDLVDGKAVLSGLVAEDGTELPDLDLKTTSIGFYAG